MAGHTENNSLAISYMTQKHLRCCCEDSEPINLPCTKCKPVQQICCLLATHSLWVKKFVFVRLYPGPTFGEEGDPCTEKGATNLCGTLYGRWPNWGHPCQSLPTLNWQVSNDCKTVTLGGWGPLVENLPRDWFKAPLVRVNPIDGTTYTLEPCPDPWPEAFTEEEATTEVMLWAYEQVKYGSTWITSPRHARAKGVCLCGHSYNCPGENPFDADTLNTKLYWNYNLYTDKTEVWVEIHGPSSTITTFGPKEFDGSGCEWANTPFYIYDDEDPYHRWYVKKLTGCEDGDTDPPDDEEECDPGCWPPCVMCPERKALFAVLTGAPTCCVTGAWGLTWVSTGGEEFPTLGYYELPAPVGGPIEDCGVIDFLRVYCVGESAIRVDLIYRRAEGTEIVSTGNVLAVTCSEEGELESAPLSIPGRDRDRESLCGFGDGVGGELRIVSA